MWLERNWLGLLTVCKNDSQCLQPHNLVNDVKSTCYTKVDCLGNTYWKKKKKKPILGQLLFHSLIEMWTHLAELAGKVINSCQIASSRHIHLASQP